MLYGSFEIINWTILLSDLVDFSELGILMPCFLKTASQPCQSGVNVLPLLPRIVLDPWDVLSMSLRQLMIYTPSKADHRCRY